MYTPVLFALTQICFVIAQVTQERIEYYENFINSNISSAINYQLPEDASEYRPNVTGTFGKQLQVVVFKLLENNFLEYGTFDYIIVGCGATGSVLARRLSEMPSASVLVLEAGEFEDEFIELAGLALFSRFSKYNWGYTSVPQTTSCLGIAN